jgi:hypothetical protein
MPGLQFTPGDAMFVAHQCVVHTTGSGEPAKPDATLDQYNVQTQQHLQGVRSRVRTNSDFGLPHFNRRIDPNALKDIATDTVMQELADLIFFQSFDVSQPLPTSAASASLPEFNVSDRGPLQAVSDFTRDNPMPALMIAASAGMLVGILFGGLLRR